MDLSALGDLGLPEWVVILAALIFILKQVGLLDFAYGHLADRREHQQQAENIAIEVLRDIIRESIQESSRESQEMRETIYRLGRQVDNNTQSARAMAGIISEQDKPGS